MVWTGKVVVIVSMIIAILTAPQLKRFDQAFVFIQDFTGLISPGVIAIFMLGMFWRKASGFSALVAALCTIPLGVGFNAWYPEIPFLHRMGYVFLILVAMMVVISLVRPRKEGEGEVIVEKEMFKMSNSFAIGSLLVMGILAALYTIYW